MKKIKNIESTALYAGRVTNVIELQDGYSLVIQDFSGMEEHTVIYKKTNCSFVAGENVLIWAELKTNQYHGIEIFHEGERCYFPGVYDSNYFFARIKLAKLLDDGLVHICIPCKIGEKKLWTDFDMNGNTVLSSNMLVVIHVGTLYQEERYKPDGSLKGEFVTGTIKEIFGC